MRLQSDFRVSHGSTLHIIDGSLRSSCLGVCLRFYRCLNPTTAFHRSENGLYLAVFRQCVVSHFFMRIISMTVFTDNPALMRSEFKSAMLKLSTLGQDLTQMVDCSEVIPQPRAPSAHGPHLPAGQNNHDIEQAVIHFVIFTSVSSFSVSVPPLRSPLLALIVALPPVLLQCKRLSNIKMCVCLLISLTCIAHPPKSTTHTSRKLCFLST